MELRPRSYLGINDPDLKKGDGYDNCQYIQAERKSNSFQFNINATILKIDPYETEPIIDQLIQFLALQRQFIILENEKSSNFPNPWFPVERRKSFQLTRNSVEEWYALRHSSTIDFQDAEQK